MKTVFSDIRSLLNQKVKITLDRDNIPKDYTLVPIDFTYLMTYNELYVVSDSKANKDNNEVSGDDGPLLDDIGKEASIESTFKINKETLEFEYNLMTLNLEKIRIINLKDAIGREDKTIRDSDMQYITEG